MKAYFKNKRVTGILTILPETICYFDDEMIDGLSIRNQKIKKNMGYHQRYRAKHSTTSSDLCIAGLKYLFEKGYVRKDEIGAIVVSSFTPDYYVPHISNLIQSRCDLPLDVLTLDIWDGCTGYISGLLQAFMVLEHVKEKKVLLFTADIINRINSEEEKYMSPPYGGDGASITVLENSSVSEDIPVFMKEDGSQRDMIALKHGAFWDLLRKKPAERSGILLNAGDSFRYFQKVVPELITEMLEEEKLSWDDVDFVSSIQPNKLSAKKMADKLQISYEKMTVDLVEHYGDMSATENPVAIVDYYMKHKDDKKRHCIFVCGYGAGLRWGTTILYLECLDFCEKLITSL